MVLRLIFFLSLMMSLSRSKYTSARVTLDATRRRIQQMLQFTFLAPEIVQMIVEGRQPIGLTSAWIERTSLPQGWQDQRELIATL